MILFIKKAAKHVIDSSTGVKKIEEYLSKGDFYSFILRVLFFK